MDEELAALLLEWLGYTASLIILISLLMSSIVKLRWINLFGAILFAVYGFMIQSLPTGFMNVGIAVIDIYFLVKMYKSKEYFTILPITEDHQYFDSFIQFYKEEINTFFNIENLQVKDADVKLYILRNMSTAGIFIANKLNDTTLNIRLDYAVPQYRDFKLARFLFNDQRDYFLNLGIDTLLAESTHPKHVQYLMKMGFVLLEKDTYSLTLK